MAYLTCCTGSVTTHGRSTDWKSGRESRDPDQLDQLAVYALYLRDRHNVESSNMRARIEWLESGNATDHTFFGRRSRCLSESDPR